MEPIIINREKHEIDPRRVTLVFNRTFGQSAYPERKMITPEESIDHFRTDMESIDPLVARLFSVVFPDFDRPVTKENLDECDAGCQHVAGLLDLSLRLIVQGVQFGWKHPETFLHPRHQGNLADVILLLSDSPRLLQLAKGDQIVNDRIVEEFESHGLRCVIGWGGPGLLNYNGYVQAPSGVTFSDHSLDVHGGVTWSEWRLPWDDHDSDCWWVGFDTAHAGDAVPGLPFDNGGVFRDQDYVRAECVRLAEQLACLDTPRREGA